MTARSDDALAMVAALAITSIGAGPPVAYASLVQAAQLPTPGGSWLALWPLVVAFVTGAVVGRLAQRQIWLPATWAGAIGASGAWAIGGWLAWGVPAQGPWLEVVASGAAGLGEQGWLTPLAEGTQLGAFGPFLGCVAMAGLGGATAMGGAALGGIGCRRDPAVPDDTLRLAVALAVLHVHILGYPVVYVSMGRVATSIASTLGTQPSTHAWIASAVALPTGVAAWQAAAAAARCWRRGGALAAIGALSGLLVAAVVLLGVGLALLVAESFVPLAVGIGLVWLAVLGAVAGGWGRPTWTDPTPASLVAAAAGATSAVSWLIALPIGVGMLTAGLSVAGLETVMAGTPSDLAHEADWLRQMAVIVATTASGQAGYAALAAGIVGIVVGAAAGPDGRPARIATGIALVLVGAAGLVGGVTLNGWAFSAF